jgi:hypothetical protein
MTMTCRMWRGGRRYDGLRVQPLPERNLLNRCRWCWPPRAVLEVAANLLLEFWSFQGGHWEAAMQADSLLYILAQDLKES